MYFVMKIKTIILIGIVFIAMYLAFAFVLETFIPNEWKLEGRFYYLLCSFFGSILTCMINNDNFKT
jgi:hypothetical protein